MRFFIYFRDKRQDNNVEVSGIMKEPTYGGFHSRILFYLSYYITYSKLHEENFFLVSLFAAKLTYCRLLLQSFNRGPQV